MARAVLFHGPGQPLEIAEFDVPEPRGTEVLVRVTCCTLCTSDLHTHSGRRPGPLPCVLGHEIVGQIAAFGPQAPRHDVQGTPLSEGNRITWSVTASCGTCFLCGEGLPQKCTRLYKYGHEAATPARPFAGGLADYVLLAEGTTIVALPDAVPDLVATPANCATATAAAVLRTAGPIAGKVVLILGAGTLGVTASALAAAAGAGRIVIIDPDPERRQRALSFGATDAVDDPAAVVADLTQGRGADVALELAGVRAAVEAGLAGLRIGGTLVLAGTVLPTPAVALDPEAVVRRLLTIRGVHNYVPADLVHAANFLAETGRRFPFAELIEGSYSLQDVTRAFAYAHSHPGKRVAVSPLLKHTPAQAF